MTLSGTFWAPHPRFLGWTASQWRQEADSMQQIGLRTIILQWTQWDGQQCLPLAESVLRMAESHGFEVYLGLAGDTRWWQRPAAVYSELVDESQSLVQLLLSRWGTHPCLAGWYLTPEIDNARMSNDDLVEGFLKPVVQAIRGLDGRPLVVSPYVVKSFSPQRVADWWRRTLQNVPIDIVALQDGVGCGRLGADQTGSLMACLSQAPTRVWGNIELFRQVRCWPLPFYAVPASAARVRLQMESAAPHVEKLICFEYPTYMSPSRGGAARRLYAGVSQK